METIIMLFLFYILIGISLDKPESWDLFYCILVSIFWLPIMIFAIILIIIYKFENRKRR